MLDWDSLAGLCRDLVVRVAQDYDPDVVVGVARVGILPKPSGRTCPFVRPILVGRLTRDPDIRMTGDGVARAWFVLAVPRPYANRDGERDADFISVVAWRQLATVIGEHLTKGRLVGLTGRLQVHNQENGDGTWRTSAEVVADHVVFLDPAARRDKTGGEEVSPLTPV